MNVRHSSFAAAILGILVALSATPLTAATHTWTGANGVSMNNAVNWIGGVPVSGSSNLALVFPQSTGNTSVTQDIANPLIVQSLDIANSYTITGTNAIRMSNLGAAPSISLSGTSTPVVTIDNAIDFNVSTTITSTANPSFGFSNPGITFTGVLTGGNLTFEGSNLTGLQHLYTLKGSNPNALTGSYLVKSRATVRLSKTDAMGGSITLDGDQSSLQLQVDDAFAAGTDLTIKNSGNFAANSTSFTLDDLSIQTPTSIGVGTFKLTGTISSTAPSAEVFGQNIDLTGAQRTVDVTGASESDRLTLSAKITNGYIKKTGPGTLRLTNSDNTFTGTNEVTAGTLTGSPQALGTVSNSASVVLESGSLNSNQLSGSGQFSIGPSSNVNFNVAQTSVSNYTLNTFSTAGGTAATLLGAFTAASDAHASVSFDQNTDDVWTGSLSGGARINKGGTGVLSLGGVNAFTEGVGVYDGGIRVLTDTALGSGTLEIYGSVAASGSRTLANPLVLAFSTFTGDGDLNFTNADPKTPGGFTIHNSTGATTIAGKWTNTNNPITVNAGHLTIGDSSVVNGFTTPGPVVVNGGTLTVRSLNFITLSDVTLAGGTLDAPNGYAIPLGAVLQGAGGVTGRIATANGASILASGNLNLGDAAHPAGVNLDGELYTRQHTVTLLDSNQAVLGALTQIGTLTQTGTLAAANGIVLNFGRNIVGRGQIQNANTLAKAAIINGDVTGDSSTNYLEFTGYVKGVGTFNNVAFSGTFAPGLSPALVEVGNVTLTSTNVLDMEIGGLTRGAQYDAFDIAGTMQLGGILKLSLLNGFTPDAGDQYQLFSGDTAGAFTGFDLPALDAGLGWDLSALTTTGIASVVAPAGDFNTDGSVDGGDFLSWQRGQSPAQGSAGELGDWQSHFGSGAANANANAVPEPTAAILLGLAMLSTASSRRR